MRHEMPGRATYIDQSCSFAEHMVFNRRARTGTQQDLCDGGFLRRLQRPRILRAEIGDVGGYKR